MRNDFGIKNEESKDSLYTTLSVENRIDALKSLAILLLREVESLENFSNINQKQNKIYKISLPDELQRYETDLIRSALIQAKGHQRRAAKILGINFTTLNTKIKRYGIELIKSEQPK